MGRNNLGIITIKTPEEFSSTSSFQNITQYQDKSVIEYFENALKFRIEHESFLNNISKLVLLDMKYDGANDRGFFGFSSELALPDYDAIMYTFGIYKVRVKIDASGLVIEIEMEE